MVYKPPVDKKPVQKTKHLHKVPKKKQIWPCIGSIKYDGVYAYQIIREGDYRIFSATGMQYHSLKHIEESGKAVWMHSKQEVVLIFEVHNSDYPVNIISGKCRDEKAQHPELYAIVHDVIPYDDFIAGFCDTPYSLREIAAFLTANVTHYMKPTTFIIKNEEHADALFEYYTNLGHEGIIGRNPDGCWYGGHKRNEDLWKKKIELSYDLEVFGMQVGTGKYENNLGTITVKFRRFGKKDGEVVMLPISGMTDAQRKAWWLPTSTESIIGKIVKVDAMTFTKNGLLREPRFKEVREDILTPEF